MALFIVKLRIYVQTFWGSLRSTAHANYMRTKAFKEFLEVEAEKCGWVFK